MKLLRLATVIFIAVLFLMAESGCARKRGCTDNAASNYNQYAEINDGSCKYTGSVVFWTQLTNTGTITVNIDSTTGSISSAVTGSAAKCGLSGCATFELKPGDYPFTASSPNGYSWSGTVAISTGKCQPIQFN